MPANRSVVPPLSPAEQGRILDFVRDINRDQPAPDVVREGLRQLRAALPQAEFELLGERENIGGVTTHCLLVTHGDLVYSLSCSRQEVLPWQLRGATNAEANELVSVNGYRLTIENAVHALDLIWEQTDIATRVVDMALLAGRIERMDAAASDCDIAAVQARFYAERKLDSAAARERWLAARGLSEAGLRGLLRDVLRKREAERALVAERLDDERRRRADDYRAVRVMACVLPEGLRDDAERLLAAAADAVGAASGISTLVAGLARASAFRLPLRIECRELLRHELSPADAEALWAGAAGDIRLAGMASGETCLLEILEVEADAPAATIERRIVRRLMQDWYRQERERARIEWHWGRTG